MLINSLVHVTVLLSDLNIPSTLQNRLDFKFTDLINHVITALDVVLKELQITRNLTLLGILTFKSHSKCYSAYLATNQLLQLFGMLFQQLFANT